MISRVRDTAEELWAKLEALPEHLEGEIIDGELYVQARPRPRHARGIGYLGLAGWRRENLPELPPENEPFACCRTGGAKCDRRRTLAMTSRRKHRCGGCSQIRSGLR